MNLYGSTALFWNVWGHRVPAGINGSLLAYASTKQVDVMGLVEVTHMRQVYEPVPAVHTSTNLKEPPSFINGYEQLSQVMGESYDIFYTTPNYRQWTCVITGSQYAGIGFGSALLVRKGLALLGQGSERFGVADDGIAKYRDMQWVVYEKGSSRYLVAHLHGIWFKENTKGDDPRRNEQSLFVRRTLRQLSEAYNVEKVVFGGDLNLAIDTEALSLLEQGEPGDVPWRNLIREYGIDNTRTPRYRKFDSADEPKHADYVFVPPAVTVHRFEVNTDNGASDHAPLLVHFS